MRLLIASLLLTFTSYSWSADPLADAVAAIDADVVFMRHALAPGFGDPDRFQVNDCATQRNLDAQGRAQATALGQRLAQSKLTFSEILSSEWCRCKETAKRLNLGPWQTFSGLNSFFQGYADAKKTLPALEKRLQARKPGVALMVSHQVVISRITGLSVGVGDMVVFNSQTKQAQRLSLP